jgi:hypothetical protein
MDVSSFVTKVNSKQQDGMMTFSLPTLLSSLKRQDVFLTSTPGMDMREFI